MQPLLTYAMKLGIARGGMNSAIDFLQAGRVAEALAALEVACSLLDNFDKPREGDKPK